ncbi:MAG: PEGA domain-containing protein [Polyangiaceae bacterium]
MRPTPRGRWVAKRSSSVTTLLLVLAASTAGPSVAFAQGAKPAKPGPAKPTPPKPAAEAVANDTKATPSSQVSAADATEGKRHFETGMHLFRDKNLEGAALEFQQSYRIGKKPSALRNLAQVHREAGRDGEAYEAFEKLLEDHDKELKDKDKKDVRRALEELANLTGALTLKVSEAGADVSVDGRAVGQSPLAKPVRVNISTHRVRVTKAGFEPFEKVVQVVSKQELPVDVPLLTDVQTGHILVRERSNAEARVFVDDKDVGATPWEGDLAPGPHTVEVKGPKIEAPKQNVDITKRGRLEVVADGVPTVGTLQIHVNPPGSSITVDGKRVGDGRWQSEVALGKHLVEVRAEGFQTYTREVDVGPGKVVSQDVALTRNVPLRGDDDGAPEGPNTYKGLYGQFGLNGAFNLGTTEHVACGSTAGLQGTCTANRGDALGGGALLRVGYVWDFIGVEAVGAFMTDYRNESLLSTGAKDKTDPTGKTFIVTPEKEVNANVQHKQDFTFLSLNGFVGLGARAMTKDRTLRLTAGLSPGVAFRNHMVTRSTSGNVADEISMKTNYTAFAMMGDVGILFGGTPGTKLFLGAVVWMDFPSVSVATPPGVGKDVTVLNSNPPVTKTLLQPQYPIASGAQVFVGPVLGLQFGR